MRFEAPEIPIIYTMDQRSMDRNLRSFTIVYSTNVKVRQTERIFDRMNRGWKLV